jgi:bacterioferritin-associated ferredoxin
MIVCLCHRVSDRDIRAAVCSGTHCFDVLQDDLRVGSSCGCCQECAREVFDAALAARPQAKVDSTQPA